MSCLRESDPDADIAHVLTMDEARCIASNIAKLPGLMPWCLPIRALVTRTGSGSGTI
jgi:hypothetical protein